MIYLIALPEYQREVINFAKGGNQICKIGYFPPCIFVFFNFRNNIFTV